MVLTNRDYTVGWFAALPIELNAASAMLDKPLHEALAQDPEDTNTYTLGSLGSHNVVMACLPSMGTSAAAFAAANMLRSFPNVRIGLMVGIGGGVPDIDGEDIRLGDIVVGVPESVHGGVLQFDFGTAIQTDKASGFNLKGYLNQPPPSLMSALRTLQAKAEREGDTYQRHLEEMLEKYPLMAKTYSRPLANTDYLYNAEYVHPGGKSNCSQCLDSELVDRSNRDEEVSVHYGLIGSSNQVLRDAMARDRWHSERGIICFEMEAAGLMNNFPCLVIRGICDYCDSHKNKKWQRYASAQAAAFAKELLLNVSPIHIEKAPIPSWILEAVDQQLQIVKDVKIDIDLNKLPSADSAAFDSSSNQLDPLCHSETRVEVRQQIRDWLDNLNGPCMLWMNGLPGAGKSTISRTMAHEFAAKSQLAASFFFRRGGGERGEASKFITTIAKQIIHNIPATKQAISEVLTQDSSIISKSFKEQFERLILNPLSKLSERDLPGTVFVIVVDALDECDDKAQLRLIIQLFAQIQILESKKIKMFMTSRPEFPIQQTFRCLSQVTYQELILQDVPDSVIKQDIYVFLKDSIARIQDDNGYPSSEWPAEKDLQMLANIVDKLFISAATFCRMISDERLDPQEQLEHILKYRHLSNTDQLSATYRPLLDQFLIGLSNIQRASLLEEFRKIIGSIVLLEDTLSVTALSSLLCIPMATIQRRMKTLHSVLNIPVDSHEDVRLHHLSFREFLIGSSQEDYPFTILPPIGHEYLARQCLNLLNTSTCLKEDIFSFDKPSVLREELKESLLGSTLPKEVRYACLYFTRHLVESQMKLSVIEDFHTFLNERLLFWIEALAWLGQLHLAVAMLDSMCQLVSAESETPSIIYLLEDARSFVSANQAMIRVNPLQLYSAGLIFSSDNGNIRHNYAKYIPDWAKRLPPVWDCWPNSAQASNSHIGAYIAIAMSHDAKQLATWSSDHTIKVWNAETGALLHTLFGHQDKVNAVVFAPDDRIISCSSDATIRIWSLTTGLLETSMIIHRSMFSTHCLTLSEDGQLLAAGGDYATFLWDMDTLTLKDILPTKYAHSDFKFGRGRQFATRLRREPKFDGDDKYGTEFCLSAENGDHLTALVSSQNSEEQWQPFEILGFSSAYPLLVIAFMPKGLGIIRSLIKTYHTSRREMVCSEIMVAHHHLLSPDGRTLASLSSSGTQLIFQDVLTLDVILKLDVPYPVRTLKRAFSSDGVYFAIQQVSEPVIFVWNTQTGKLHQKLNVLHDYILREFSSTGVICQGFGCIQAWDLCSKYPTYRINHTPPPTLHYTKEDLSPDGKTLVSYLEDVSILRVWDCETGMIRFDVDIPVMDGISVSFSPDARYMITDLRRGRLDFTMQHHVVVWEADTGAALWSLNAIQRSSLESNVRLSPDSKLLVSQMKPTGPVGIFDISTGKLVGEIDVGDDSHETAYEFSVDSKLLAVGLKSGVISIWSTNTRTVLTELPGQMGLVHLLRFSPNGELLASLSRASHDLGLDVKVFDMRSGLIVYTIHHTLVQHGPWEFVFSDNSKKLIFGRPEHWTILDFASRTQLPVSDIVDDCERLLFSSDGNKLVSFSYHSYQKDAIKILDACSLKSLQTIDEDPRVHRMSFQTIRDSLDTSRGIIYLKNYVSDGVSPHRRARGNIFVSEKWLCVGGERLLWLPPAYRPHFVQYRDGRFVLFFPSATVMVFDEGVGRPHCVRWLSKAREYGEIIEHPRSPFALGVLQKAIQSEQANIVRRLISEWSLETNPQGRSLIDVLHYSAHHTRLDLVKMLIQDYGADVNAKGGPYHSTILASIHSSPTNNGNLKEETQAAIVEFLMEHNADPNILDASGKTVFHYAALSGNLAVWNVLCKTGRCDLEVMDNSGKTVLYYAFRSGSYELIKNLLKDNELRGVDLCPSPSWSPFHWAFQKGSLKLVELLMQAGMVPWTVETDDPAGIWTPLDIATYFCNKELVTDDGQLKDVDRLRLLAESASSKLGEKPNIFEQCFSRMHSLSADKYPHSICDGCFSAIYGVRFNCLDCEYLNYCFMCKHDLVDCLRQREHQWQRIDGHSS